MEGASMRELEGVPEAKRLALGTRADRIVRPAAASPRLPAAAASLGFRQSDILSRAVRPGYILQLQQRYGNRYVQRVLDRVGREEVKRQIAPDAASGTGLEYGSGQKVYRGLPTEAVLADGPSKPGSACETFPGGSTDCEMDERTGTPTGKVTHHVDETNPCSRPCVEEHEAVHVKQLTAFCPKLRDCYLAADQGKRPASDCLKLALSDMKQRECEAYKVSVPCMEKRLKNAKECQKENKDYGARKLASEKCFRDQACGAA
jgi:hypothetical protein